MRKFWLIIMAVVLLAFVSGITARRIRSQSQIRAYTLISQATDYDSSGKGTPYYTETCYVSSSGNSYCIRNYADGRQDEKFAIVGKGVYAKRGRKLDFLSEYQAPHPTVSEDRLRRSPHYLRTESVLGHPAVVVRAANGGPDAAEFYRSSLLGGQVIKQVYDNGRGKTVIEPVSLTFGEPNAALLRLPEDLPVDYKHFEEMHGPRPLKSP